MPHFDKHFTLQEANALLPRIREVFGRIQTLIDETKDIVKPLASPPEKISPGRTNGKQKKERRSREEIAQEINDLVTEITDGGIVIQDVYRGLIDFPSFVNGEEVFLCYEMNDGDSIQFWHAIDAGYAGRRPLPEGME